MKEYIVNDKGVSEGVWRMRPHLFIDFDEFDVPMTAFFIYFLFSSTYDTGPGVIIYTCLPPRLATLVDIPGDIWSFRLSYICRVLSFVVYSI